MGGSPAKLVENIGDAISDVGSDVDDFVNEEIPGGWYTVGAVAGGAALANAGAATAGATGTGAGLVGEAAVVPGMEGALGTGLSTSAGTIGSVEGLSGVLGAGETLAGAGTGFSASALTAPELAAMGGGTGLLTEAAGGGTVGSAGVTPTGAVQAIGDPASVINNPAVLGTDVIGYQAPMSIKSALDTIRTANSIKNMLGQPTAQQPQWQQRAIQPYGSVQYPSLSLLEMRPIQRPTSLV